ncbi:MAG TPA: glycosyltransferase family 2 protein [Blastocatellia bacterium]|nr:glycosyltransferase family 2 protein [Blastocatellia bacterium]
MFADSPKRTCEVRNAEVSELWPIPTQTELLRDLMSKGNGAVESRLATMKISATVITFNEEHNIAEALESLAWADEIIVVDRESTDQTVEIARRFTDRVFVREWQGYSAQKNFAAEQAQNDWIFSLDADERVSPELAGEIQKLKQAADPEASGFEMSRLTFYLGRWIRHSGWYPDRKLRLYDRRRAGWRGDYVHESLEVKGRVERLAGNILHFTVRSASEHHARLDRYTSLAAKQAQANGKHGSFFSIVFSPPAAFVRSYILRLGFLDGRQGFIIARFAAHYAFLKNLKLWEMKHNEPRQD